MITRSAIALALGFGLLGALGGLFGVLLTPASYQAEAFVVVYEMPTGFNNLISPDEANSINAFYQAGALQDNVIQRIRIKYPTLQPQDIRAAVQVSIVAYTPLTRVTATAASPQVAVTLANAVATAWVGAAGYVISLAYDTTYTGLVSHESALNQQIAAVTAQLAPLNPSSTKAQALKQQLQSLQAAFTATDASIAELEKDRFDVAGNAYVATPATDSTVSRSPGFLKSTAAGGAAGLALGIVCVLWLIRTSLLTGSKFAYLAPPATAAPGSTPLYEERQPRRSGPPARISYDN